MQLNGFRAKRNGLCLSLVVGLYALLIVAFQAIKPAYADDFRLNSHLRLPFSTAKGNGVLDQVIREAFRRAGHRVTIKQLPMRRGLASADLGDFDGHFPRTKDAVATFPNLIVVNQPMFQVSIVAITRSGYQPITKWGDLSPLKVGYPSGWKVVESRKAYLTKAAPVNNVAKLLKMLIDGRVDVILQSERYFKSAARQISFNDYQIHRPSLLIREMYLVMNKRHKEVAAQIDKALGEMIKDGTLARLCPGCLDPGYFR